MFEQAVLPTHHGSGRFWSAALGLTGELLAVACLLIAPLLWPQLLLRVQTPAWITAPAAPSPPVKNPPPVHVRAIRTPFQMADAVLYRPITIPPRVVTFDDPPAAGQNSGGENSIGIGDARSILDSVLRQVSPERVAEPSVAAPQVNTAPAAPIRIRLSGVQMARLVHRVEPVYPMLARQARVSGTVELTGVIGTDGRIRELRVLSGHLLLAGAALDAVRQWVYEPTLLNGSPVEVIAPITVNFRLN